MKKHKKQVVIGVLIAFFLVVIVPMIINACYTTEHIIFYTAWGGADVLAYYGTILGSTIAVISLIITISFTRKQLKSERYREAKREEWKEIERTVDELIEHINPMRINEYIEKGTTQSIHGTEQAERSLIDFHLKAVYLYDSLQSRNYGTHLNFFKELCNTMYSITSQAKEYRSYLRKVDDLLVEYKEAIAIGEDSVDFSSSFADLDKEKEQISSELLTLHENIYVPLICKKQAEFDKIYQEISEDADHILYF